MPVQIHHIDANHDNNERSNLAVMCDRCHKLSHTTIPFSCNLSPDIIRKYDGSWRARCAAKLQPETSKKEYTEYCQEVYLEISLTCHDWKNCYMALYPGHFRSPAREFKDIWERMIHTGNHEESDEERNKYRPLFEEPLSKVVDSLNTILACHGDAIPPELKTLVIRTKRQLSVEQMVFRILALCSVKSRSEGVLRALSILARAADALTSMSPVVHFKE